MRRRSVNAESSSLIGTDRRGEAASARAAGLRYASDRESGLARKKSGPGFLYRDAQGRAVDRKTSERIRALVIPPAWTDVWIAADARAHLQATGRDARNRKQYRYHPRWSAVRDTSKYDRISEFGRVLPAIRRRVSADLRARRLSRPWVLATVARLLEHSVIRIGNPEYRRANGSYGLTTLLNRHVDVRASTLTLKFRAKSGVEQVVEVTDAVLARRVRHCLSLPGRSLFQYLDDRGRPRPIGSADVNAYLRQAAGAEFTAKDFRTWAGTLEASRALDAAMSRHPASGAARKRELIRALDDVAGKLGNTRAVCRKSYVHPAILKHYFEGRTLSTAGLRARGPAGLSPDERALVALLEYSTDQAKTA
jgi:DNA topoisomerase-1